MKWPGCYIIIYLNYITYSSVNLDRSPFNGIFNDSNNNYTSLPMIILNYSILLSFIKFIIKLNNPGFFNSSIGFF